MGNCSSCKSTSVAAAKLILLDGELEEYSCPIKVSQVLEKINVPECFICNSDDMDFNDFVLAINDDEELQPGQLYFVLPVSWLGRPLQAADMASLAVKASLALTRRGREKFCGCWNKGLDGLIVYEDRSALTPSRSVVVAEGEGGRLAEERRVRRSPIVSGGRGHKLTGKLSVILEE